MNVRIPTPLRAYTANAAVVTADGTTIDELLRDLDRRYPGLRFRVVDEQGRLRKHMIVWLNGERCRDLSTSVHDGDDVVFDASALRWLLNVRSLTRAWCAAAARRRALSTHRR